MLRKDDAEHPIPEPWRSTFRQIAAALMAGDFLLREHVIDAVAPVDPEIAQNIGCNIEAYGAALAPLNDATWERSVYRWMEGYWEMLVDLSTEGEPVSDLSVLAHLREGDGLPLEIISVHVP